MTTFEKPRKLDREDDLEGFSCGDASIDTWVHARAKTVESKGTAVVYVAYGNGMVAGIYSLSAHSVVRDEVKGGWLKRNTPESIPTVLLGMLGVDKRFQGQGLGSSLLKDAFQRAVVVSEQIGAKALLVDPFDDGVKAFYKQFGFKEVPGQSRMYLPLLGD